MVENGKPTYVEWTGSDLEQSDSAHIGYLAISELAKAGASREARRW